MLNVESIQNGIVIDHIPAGKGMDIYRLLELESKTQSVALLQSVKSQKYGCKDLIKIEGETLPERLDVLGYLDSQITQALINMRYHHMTDKELNRLSHMILAVSDIERISDHAENLTQYMLRLKEQKIDLSPEAEKDLIEMCQAVMAATHISMEVFANDDFDRLQEAEWLENVVDDLEEQCVDKHMERLLNNTCNPVCGVVFSDMVTDLERCADHAVNIAFALSGKSEKHHIVKD